MLGGRKPLAMFYDDADQPADAAIVPEPAFDPYVQQGRFAKDELILEVADPQLGQPVRVRYVLYAVRGEEWRIPAALLTLRTLQQVNAIADEGLERLLCALLGYSDDETAACLEAQVLERC